AEARSAPQAPRQPEPEQEPPRRKRGRPRKDASDPNKVKWSENEKGQKRGANGEIVHVVDLSPVVYVDSSGNRLPDLGPDLALPVILAGCGIVFPMLDLRPGVSKE